MTITAKETAKRVIEHLPEQAGWDDILYELHARQKIEEGLKASDEGRVVPQREAKRRLLSDAD